MASFGHSNIVVTVDSTVLTSHLLSIPGSNGSGEMTDMTRARRATAALLGKCVSREDGILGARSVSRFGVEFSPKRISVDAFSLGIFAQKVKAEVAENTLSLWS